MAVETTTVIGGADQKELIREEQTLKSPDILAIKGLAQFKRFPAVVALGNLIENWHVSDFHISRARPRPDMRSICRVRERIYLWLSSISIIIILRLSTRYLSC